METLQKIAILLELTERLREAGSWAGETHVQKAAYIFESLFGAPLGYRFVLYHYGPFSFELSEQLDALLADQYLAHEYVPGPYNPKHTLTDRGRSFRDRFPKTVDAQRARLEAVVRWVGDKRVVDLEKLATALYVTREDASRSDVRARAERLHQLKPHIPVTDAEVAVRQVDEMLGSVPAELVA